MSTPTPAPTPVPTSNCQDTFNHLSSKYWEALNSMGIGFLWESPVSNASDLIQRMQSYLTYDHLRDTYCGEASSNPTNLYDTADGCAIYMFEWMADFYDKVRAQSDDKRRQEIILDYLGNTIRRSLSEDDLRLSNNSRCNFLGDDINDISDWGKENGPHDGSDNVDDFLKHNFPFLKPPPRISSLPSPQQPMEGGRRKSRKKKKSRRKIPFSKKVRKTKRRRTTKKKRKTKRRRTKKQKGGNFGPDGPIRMKNAPRQQNLKDARYFVQFLKTPLVLDEYKLVSPEGGPNNDKIDEALLRWWKKLGEDQDDKNKNPHGVMHLFNDWIKTHDYSVVIPWYDYYRQQHRIRVAENSPSSLTTGAVEVHESMREPILSSDEDASNVDWDDLSYGTFSNLTDLDESISSLPSPFTFRSFSPSDFPLPATPTQPPVNLGAMNQNNTNNNGTTFNYNGTNFNPVDNPGLSMVENVMFQQFGQPQQPIEGGLDFTNQGESDMLGITDDMGIEIGERRSWETDRMWADRQEQERLRDGANQGVKEAKEGGRRKSRKKKKSRRKRHKSRKHR